MINVEISVPETTGGCAQIFKAQNISKIKNSVAHGFNVPTLFTTKFSDWQLKFEDSWVKHFELFELLLLFFMYTTSEVVFSC